MPRNFKIVFYVEDAKTKDIVVEKSQVYIALSDEELTPKSLADVQWKDGPTSPEGVALIERVGWEAQVGEHFDAAGTAVGRFVRDKILAMLKADREAV